MIVSISDKYLFSHSSDIDALNKALLGQKLSGTSSLVNEYETALATYFGSKYALTTSSGSSALHTALHAIGATEGAEVLLPACSPFPTGLAVLTARATPVFVDVLPNSFDININDVIQKITTKTKAIIVIPMWGYPQEYENLFNLLKEEYGIFLIEDAAQAHFSKIKNKFIGTFGHIGCFSTHDRKILSTGEGGFILTDEPEFAERAMSFTRFGNMDKKSYGTNYKLSTLQAALGLSRLKYAPKQLIVRRDNAFTILKGIHETPCQEIAYPNESIPNYYALVVKILADIPSCRLFIEWLSKKEIPSDILSYGLQVLYHHPLFSQWYSPCPNAENMIKTITTIPVHPDLETKHINYMIENINEYWRIK